MNEIQMPRHEPEDMLNLGQAYLEARKKAAALLEEANSILAEASPNF